METRTGNQNGYKGVPEKHGPAFHLFQEEKCTLIIGLVLTNTKNEKMGHCVGYDGNRVYDKPHVLELNKDEDNLKSWNECKSIFGSLYPKCEFKSWQIVGVYDLIKM